MRLSSDTYIIGSHWPSNIGSRAFQIYNLLSDLEGYYPDFRNWYFAKVLPGIFSGSRFIITKRIGIHIAGVAILKKCLTEKKICTLRVMDGFRGTGIGSSLIFDSFRILETNQPLISVAETMFSTFSPILDKYGFTLYMRYSSVYQPDIAEMCFNGYLDNSNNEPVTIPAHRANPNIFSGLDKGRKRATLDGWISNG